MAAPTIFPGARSFFGVGRELSSGTAVAPQRNPPMMKFDPEDTANPLVDEGLRGSMAKEYGMVIGKKISAQSFEGPVFDDYVGDVSFNTLGDYVTTATAAAPNSSLSGALAAGVTSVPVVSGTGFAANQWIQVGPDTTGGAELVQVLSVATNTITLTPATPLRFGHAAAAPVTNTANTSGYAHVMSLLNSGPTGQPPTHTFTDYQGITATVGARAYPFAAVEELTFTGNAEKLLMLSGKTKSFVSAAAATTPTNAPTSEVVQPSWQSTVTLAGVQLMNIAEWAVTLKRELITPFAADGTQNPYTIGRGALTVEGKLTFIAADESPLTAYLAGTIQSLVVALDNGLAGANHRVLNVQMTKVFYKKNSLKRTGLIGWETEFSALANTTDTGFSTGLSPCKVSLTNQVPTF